MPYRAVNLSRVKTYPLPQRQNRVDLADLIRPETPCPPFESADLSEVCARIAAARQSGRPVIWMIGAHVVKRGLAPLLIDLMQRGVITHLASNGAATIHDFEIAFQGHTSEDVAASLADGSFGMAEETGAFMNRAIRQGARLGMGIGEALGRWMDEQQFPYRENSLVYTAYRLGIPYTVHVAIGTDIIHQHPEVDFAATGWASGQDFKVFTESVRGLEGGVFCNFGSAVLGPEVFLKAVSIARNLGSPLKVFTTANFDLVDLGDYRKPIGDDQVDYYYRPRKNIVNRPVMLGGKGFHICGDHLATIPNLYRQVTAGLAAAGAQAYPAANQRTADAEISAPAQAVLDEMLARYPELAGTAPALAAAFRTIRLCYASGGTLYTAGNGGSMADAIHIVGELDKSFKLKRAMPAAEQARLEALGEPELARELQPGLRSITLGVSPALSSAVDNDFATPHTNLAQELYALARPGDVLLGISTSGNARNVNYAAQVARALGVSVISFTGADGGKLAAKAAAAVRAPAKETDAVQNLHVILYHALCSMLEAHFFGG
jgi:phosphoheptose isomerase